MQQTVSAERGVNVTMLAFVRADGGNVPPTFVFPRKKVIPDMFKDGPIGCLGLAHESGWMTGENFYKSSPFPIFCEVFQGETSIAYT